MTLLTELDLKKGVEVSYQSLRARLSDEKGKPYSICRDRPLDAVGMERMTTIATIIMEMKTGMASVTIGRPCDNIPIIRLSFP